jgi:DNA-binding FadR family transcriptional regulator
MTLEQHAAVLEAIVARDPAAARAAMAAHLDGVAAFWREHLLRNPRTGVGG